MTFAHPGFLLLLLAVPLVAWAAWRGARRPGAVTFSDTGAAAAAPPTLWVRLRHAPIALRAAALTLGVLALARPQERDVLVRTEAEGIDIMLVLDLSTSMLARDFQPNRFEAAREVAARFVEERAATGSADRIGLVVFAPRAYTRVPLTRDHAFLASVIRQIGADQLEDGTAIGTALATAVARLRTSEAESRVVILLTDGQNNTGEVDPLTAGELAAAMGARVYTIGIGGRGGVDVFGRPVPPHLLEMMPDDGVDEASLTAIAERTGGRFFFADDREALGAVYREISALERTAFEEEAFLDVRERYAAFLWPAFLLLLLEVTLVSTRLLRIP